MATATSPPPKRRLRRALLVIAALAVAVWFIFLDSHSLMRRVTWHQEHARLVAENEELRQRVAELEAALATPVSDEVIEKIAREEYGMRRPGETVYRVESVDESQ